MEESKLPIEKDLEQILALAEPDPAIGYKCQEILTQPISKETCESFRAIRRRNMCRTWEIVNAESLPFRDAIKKAWDETLGLCKEAGIHSPEPTEVEKAVEMLDHEGKKIGAISLMTDGTVEVCHRDIGCEFTSKPSPESFYLAQSFFSEVFGYGMRHVEGE